jgi:hypothetical protein
VTTEVMLIGVTDFIAKAFFSFCIIDTAQPLYALLSCDFAEHA